MNLESYRGCCRQGTDWLLQQLNADGSIGPVADDLYYYRAPWTFALVGEIEAASRALEWTKRNMLTPEGALEGGTPQGVFADRYGCYPLSCLLTGAALLQRADRCVHASCAEFPRRYDHLFAGTGLHTLSPIQRTGV